MWRRTSATTSAGVSNRFDGCGGWDRSVDLLRAKPAAWESVRTPGFLLSTAAISAVGESIEARPASKTTAKVSSVAAMTAGCQNRLCYGVVHPPDDRRPPNCDCPRPLLCGGVRVCWAASTRNPAWLATIPRSSEAGIRAGRPEPCAEAAVRFPDAGFT
jgi:hypothetical protein